MKLIDKIIEASEPVRELANAIGELATTLDKVATQLAKVAQNQAAHHKMIMHMWQVQQALLKKMTEGGVDTSLPDIDGPKKSKDDKGPDKPKSN